MGIIKGGFLRLSQTFLYVLAFLCSALIVGIYSYFLAVLADRNVSIPTYAKAVEGISGIATLFTIFAVVLTCCLGGMAFFGLLAVALNILIMGGFIAIAVLTRSAVHSCSSNNNIRAGPLGRAADSGFDNNVTYSVSPRTACRLNKAVFIVSIIGAFLFLVCALVQLLLVRSAKKEKRYGPSPANDYTSGYGASEKKVKKERKPMFWQKKQQRDGGSVDLVQPVPAGTRGAAGPDMRPSYETATTVGNGGVYDKDATAVPAVPAGGMIYGHETATNSHTQHHHY